jgi:hypothetical protein
MNRRDFLRTGTLAATASGLARAADEPLKLPFKGDMFRRDDGRIVLAGRGLLYAVSDDGGRRWSQPREVHDSSLPDKGLAVKSDSHVLGLRRLKSGRVGLCYGRWQQVGNQRRQEIFFRTSIDEGRSWSPEVSVTPLPGDDLYALHGSLTQLESGRLILPAYTSLRHDYVGRPKGIGHTWLPEYYATHMLYSDDEGVTWDATGALFHWKDMGHDGSTPCGEACVAETPDGRLLMLARSTNMRVLRSYSSDGGETWTMVEMTDLNNSNAPVRLVRVPGTGDLLIVWNQVSAREQRDGYGRSRLSIAVSRDAGRSWRNFKTLELSPGMDESAKVADREPPRFVRSGESTQPGTVPDNAIAGYVRASYPNVHFFGDELYIDHDHWFRRSLWSSEKRDEYQKLHILPLDWLYS